MLLINKPLKIVDEGGGGPGGELTKTEGHLLQTSESAPLSFNDRVVTPSRFEVRSLSVVSMVLDHNVTTYCFQKIGLKKKPSDNLAVHGLTRVNWPSES